MCTLKWYDLTGFYFDFKNVDWNIQYKLCCFVLYTVCKRPSHFNKWKSKSSEYCIFLFDIERKKRKKITNKFNNRYIFHKFCRSCFDVYNHLNDIQEFHHWMIEIYLLERPRICHCLIAEHKTTTTTTIESECGRREKKLYTYWRRNSYDIAKVLLLIVTLNLSSTNYK